MENKLTVEKVVHILHNWRIHMTHDQREQLAIEIIQAIRDTDEIQKKTDRN